MINDLSYAVCFPTNGVGLTGTHTFQPGATAISGRNGKGKSFIAEMVRYGLFGKKALRGPASDYKKLDMSLTFSVGDASYGVTRAKKEELVSFDGDEVIAVGADAVNKKIIEILGFDLEVFDVVCSANQKESERLTRLTPTKRKELIDEVVGLTAQEGVEKACRDEANGLKREAEVLNRALVLPEEPVKPDGYRPSTELQIELRETKTLVDERARLQRVIDQLGVEPIEPDEAPLDLAKIELHEKTRIASDAHRLAVERQLASMPLILVTPKELEEAEALAAYDAEVARRGPRPDYKERELIDWIDVWNKKGLLAHDTATCPKCSHEFVLDRTDVDLAAIEALPKPPISLQEAEHQLRRHDFWINEPVEPKGVRMSAQEIAAGRAALQNAPMRAALQKELADLSPMEDKSEELAKARTLDRQWDIYARETEQYMIRVAAANEAEEALAKLPEPKHTIAELDAAFVAARVYESQLATYEQQKSAFETLSAEIAEKQERSDAFMAGAKGLVEARRTLKAFLAPSLSRVASHTIRQMTSMAERPLDTIDIDEDMNITVDGQDVSTFNGAHATMINLALRLALGQVLVSRVMPLFIGDEIDSDLDEANSQMLVDALLALKDQLKQVVVISHKQLEGFDYDITL